MAVEAADDLAAFFNAAEFGVAATYTPPAGGSTSCTIVVLDGDPAPAPLAGKPQMVGRRVLVRASEITPAAAGVFVTADDVFTIAGAPVLERPERAIWICQVG